MYPKKQNRQESEHKAQQENNDRHAQEWGTEMSNVEAASVIIGVMEGALKKRK